MMRMGVLLSPIDFILVIALYIYANKHRAEKRTNQLNRSLVNDSCPATCRLVYTSLVCYSCLIHSLTCFCYVVLLLQFFSIRSMMLLHFPKREW